MIYELMESIEWMDFDSMMKVVRFASDTPGLFSKGLDITSLKYHIKNGNKNEIFKYIHDVQNLAIYMSRINKPLLTELSGELKNAACSIFGQMAMVNADKDTTMVFNEIDLGTVLLGGNSYTLSRLPRGVGEYIALVGAELNYYDIYKFGIANKKVKLSETDLQKLEKSYMISAEFPEIIVIKRSKFVRSALQKTFGKEKFSNDLSDELTHRIMQGENPKSVLTDLIYQKEITHMANDYEASHLINKFEAELQELMKDESVCMIENRMRSFEVIHLDQMERQQARFYAGDQFIHGNISPHVEKLQYVFGRDTYEEAIEVLEKNLNDPICKKVHKKIMNLQDKNLAKVLFNQVKEARGMDYVSSIKNEFEAAMKWYGTEDQGGIKLASQVNSLLPVRNFYKFLPDALRYTLNDNFCYGVAVTKNYVKTVEIFLQLYGFDIANPATNYDVIREEFWRRRRIGEIRNEKENLLKLVTQNLRFNKEFLGERETAIKNFLNDPNGEEKLEKIIVDAFNNEFFKNVQLMEEKNDEVARLVKRKQFNRLREICIDFNMMQNTDESNKTQVRAFVVPEIRNNIDLVSDETKEEFDLGRLESFYDSNSKFENQHINKYFNGELQPQELVKIEKKSDVGETYERKFYKGEKKRYNFIDNLWYNYYKLNNYVTGEINEEDEFKIEFVNESLKFLEKKLGAIPKETQARLRKEIEHLHFYHVDEEKNRIIPNENVEILIQEKIPDFNFDGAKQDIIYGEKQPEALIPKENFDKIFDENINSLLDLNFKNKENLSDSQQLTFEDDTAMENYIKEQIFLDESLKNSIGLIFENEKLAEFLGPFLKTMKRDILELTRNKIKQVLEISNLEGKSFLPQIQGDFLEGEDSFMQQIDAYLNKNLRFEFFRYISSHVLYRFSFLQLKKFETIFTDLISDDGRAVPTNQIIRIIEQRAGVKLRGKSEVKMFTKFLDQFALELGSVMNKFEGKLHFEEDILMLKNKEIVTQVVKAGGGNPSAESSDYQFIEYFRKLAEEESKGDILNSSDITKGDDQILEAAEMVLEDVSYPDLNKNMVNKIVQRYRQISSSMYRNRKVKANSYGSLILLEGYYKRLIEGKDSGIIKPEFGSQDLYWGIVDLKQSGQEWLEDSIKDYFEGIFAIRKEAEKRLSHAELVAYDQLIAKYFEFENVQQIVLEELENLKFKIQLLRELKGRELERENALVVNNTRGVNMSYFMRNRVKNSKAFNQFKTLFMMIDYRKSKDIEEYTDEDKVLDRIVINRLLKESQLDEGTDLDKFSDVLKEEEEKDEDEEEIEEFEYDQYCNMIIRSMKRANAGKEDEMREKINDYVKRLDLYGIE